MRHRFGALSTIAMLVGGSLAATSAEGVVIFSADFNSTQTAQVAGGSPAPSANTATLDGGALNTSAVAPGSGLRYQTAGNFNPTAGTIEMWVRVPGYTGSSRMDLFSIFQGSYDGDFGLYFLNTQGGRLQSYVDANGAQQFFQNGFSTPAVTGDGNWHHVAWEWDTTAGTPFSTLYLDGVAENYTHFGSVTWPGGATLGTFMEFGSRQNGYDPIQTHIDDVKIHNNAIYNQVSSFTPAARTVPEPTSLAMVAAAAAISLRRSRRGIRD